MRNTLGSLLSACSGATAPESETSRAGPSYPAAEPRILTEPVNQDRDRIKRRVSALIGARGDKDGLIEDFGG